MKKFVCVCVETETKTFLSFRPKILPFQLVLLALPVVSHTALD